MRKAAVNAGVTWDYQEIVYKQGSIGYKNGDKSDIPEIKDALKMLIGYPPVERSEQI
jgi:hypothetical protein